jgi:DNA-binding transcriptional regulator GbsR (MarR family)
MQNIDMETMTINKQQLKLLTDPKNYPLLQLLETPHNPSEAAKRFNLPTNSLHHRFKKLSEANLIKLVSKRGNRRSYQTVATRFKIEKKFVMSYEANIPAFLERNFQLIQKHFQEVSEKHFSVGDTDKPYIFFWLNEKLKINNYAPTLLVQELALTEKQYTQLATVVSQFLEQAQEKNKSEVHLKHCTITYIACEGGAISGKTN